MSQFFLGGIGYVGCVIGGCLIGFDLRLFLSHWWALNR